MKHRILYIFVVLLLTTTVSCEKDDIVENAGIVGKWQLVEEYDGYLYGGSYTWNKVKKDDSHIVSFLPNGEYFRQENISRDNQECNGTYDLQASNKLEINSNCHTLTVYAYISELTPTMLIIDHQVIEGVIREKYSAIK